MTYSSMLMEAVGALLPLLLLLPGRSLGKLFKTAVSYMANDPDPRPLPPDLEPAWQTLQTALDVDVASCASPRTIFHTLSCRRLWYLKALADEDASRLAEGFILHILGREPEFASGPAIHDAQLQAHFMQSAAALGGQLPERMLKTYRKIRTALNQVQKKTIFADDEKNYLTGCLVLLELEQQGETANGRPLIQDAEQLAILLAARWLLGGGTVQALDIRPHRERAMAYFGGASPEPEDPAPDAAAAPESPSPAGTDDAPEEESTAEQPRDFGSSPEPLTAAGASDWT